MTYLSRWQRALLYVFFLGLLGWGFLGCTRRVTNNARVTIQNPGIADKIAQSISSPIPTDYTPFATRLNISGPGMNLQAKAWNCEDESCSGPIDMYVPAGSGRLIQLLIIYRNDSVGNMIYYYGEVTRDLNPGDNDIDITTAANGTTTGKEARIAGQYVTGYSTTGGYATGPTDQVDVFFNPSEASRPMWVDSTEIFNGWFSVFALNGVHLDYRLRSNGAILTGLDLETLKTNTPSTMEYWTMPSKMYNSWDDTIFNPMDGGDLLIGYLAAPTPPASAALTDLNPTITYNSDSTLAPANYDNLFYGPDAGSFMELSINPAAENNQTVIRQAGGSPTGTGGCTTSNSNFKDKLCYDPAQLEEGLNDSVPFSGPFNYQASTTLDTCSDRSGYLLTCYNPTTTKTSLQWSYLPGVFDAVPGTSSTQQGISGVAVFVKVLSQTCDDNCIDHFKQPNSDNIRCGELQPIFGFTKVADDGAANTTWSSSDFSIPTNGQLVAFVCPYRESGGQRIYFGSALIARDLTQ